MHDGYKLSLPSFYQKLKLSHIMEGEGRTREFELMLQSTWLTSGHVFASKGGEIPSLKDWGKKIGYTFSFDESSKPFTSEEREDIIEMVKELAGNDKLNKQGGKFSNVPDKTPESYKTPLVDDSGLDL